MPNQKVEWRFVMLVYEGRIRRGRYRISGRQIEVEYAGVTKDGKFSPDCSETQQAERLLRDIVDNEQLSHH